jgi:hypothetical protein
LQPVTGGKYIKKKKLNVKSIKRGYNNHVGLESPKQPLQPVKISMARLTTKVLEAGPAL